MEAWFIQHFLNPTMAMGGAALVASPIIIHLINRLRFRRIRFAAMEFLLQSQQRNRRRVLIEQLLLLLLRILIVLALVALIARLILDPRELSLVRGVQAHHVVVLDDSGSMRERGGDHTAFENAVEVVRKLVSEGTRHPGTLQFSLILASEPEQPLFTQREINQSLLQEVEIKLENLRCTHRAVSLLPALESAAKLLTEQRGQIRHVHVVSDYRVVDWETPDPIVSLVKSLEQAGTTVNFVRTVEQSHPNLAITELTGDTQIAASGVPVRLTVRVQNFSDTAAKDVRLQVSQDGTRLPLTIAFDEVPADASVEREFDVTFAEPGKHGVVVSLQRPDSLDADNARYLALDVSLLNRVLIIDGDPGAEESSYLVDALAADPSITGYAPVVESVEYLRQRPLDEFQSIFLINVANLPPDALVPLEEFVSGGGGLAWYLGDQVNASFYNEALYRDGRGLFGLKLASAPAELPRDDEASPAPDLVLSDHPIFRVFSGQENPYIDAARVYRYFPPAEDWERDDQRRGDGVQTIARLRNGDPLFLTHRFGRGRVVSCTTTCGPSWNNLALYASFVVMQLELQKFIARPDRALPQRTVGEPIRIELDPAEYTEEVQFAIPDPAGVRVLRQKAVPKSVRAEQPGGSDDDVESASVDLVAELRDTDQPGIYRVQLMTVDQLPVERWLAYNVPLRESRLKVVPLSDLRTKLADTAAHVQPAGELQWLEGKPAGQDVRNVLLGLLLVLLLSEQALAYRLSYHSS
ncbi:MAG: VWA domain-containing protein [Planctomycetota bacterium]|nr:MAG: VWA domain-containing protein [Planctomycetota bacterium]